MNIWVKQLFVILLIIAFTPLAFGLMPLLVVAGIIGSIYMLVVMNHQQHHHFE
tara:strand:+ start:509 stop:667 length:159 start_codon:yes stop_codon:yes gene_type:complete